jgi:hypothetical protein
VQPVCREVDVGPAQAADLAEAQAGEQGRQDERSQPGLRSCQQGLLLLPWEDARLEQFERRRVAGVRLDQSARAAFAPAVRAEARRLRDEEGLSFEQIGLRVGVAKATAVDLVPPKVTGEGSRG